MSKLAGGNRGLEAFCVLFTGPFVVFAVADWFLRILPTPLSVAVSVLALVASVALARRWDRVDGIRGRSSARGYRGRHVSQTGDPSGPRADRKL